MCSSIFSRRKFLSTSATAAAVFSTLGSTHPHPAAAGETATALAPLDDGVELHWLDGTPSAPSGATWGVPWPQGTARPRQPFSLTTTSGDPVPVQSWPLAYWPDGSLKWSGHAIGPDAPQVEKFRLAAGAPAQPGKPVRVERTGGEIWLSNGTVQIRLGTEGHDVIRSIRRGDKESAQHGRLVLVLQDNPDEAASARRTEWTGAIDDVVVEQQGPVRAVVKLSGTYRRNGSDSGQGDRTLLPWTMRVSLDAGAESVRLVHSFVWDGDMTADFIRGLGLRVRVPMADEAHNRHIRFAGQGRGIWGEPVRVLTGLRREPGAAVDRAQIAGTATPPVSEWSAEVRDGYQRLPLWNDFTLAQHSTDQFAVWKRTSDAAGWLKHAGRGDRAPGFGYVGSVSGGLGFGMRDFWQQYPRALDITSAAGDTATVTLWSWSPHAEAMDLRPYDDGGHGLGLAYEDDRTGWGEPTGVSRSTDMQLWAFDATPSRDRIADLAGLLTTRPQVVASPAVYDAARVFGRWSLPNRSTPALARLEDSIEASIDFYANQVDQRRWYGFWDFGDVMHTYDVDRHEWRYDVGGYAWDNAELGTDAMLWYAFLRSGKPKAFHLARAMTQHVAEVDTYHAGPYAGLGSRHNVLHWGDGAKEARVSESYTKRFLYYLTADELVGDWMRSALQADQTLLTQPPLREYFPTPDAAPTWLRIGPDWYALVSNWLTEWERTGDTKWRDLIITGMRDIARFPAGLFTGDHGGAVGFNPATGRLTNLDKGDFKGGYNLSMAFCGDQIMFETVELVDVPEFRKTLVEFARYVQAPSNEKIEHYGHDFNPQVFKTIYSRVTAWAGDQLDDRDIRKRGWDKLMSDPAGQPWPEPERVSGTAVLTPVDEIPAGDFGTNDAAQRNLAIIELIAIAPEEAPVT